MLVTGWPSYADTVASLFIVALSLPRSIALLWEVGHGGRAARRRRPGGRGPAARGRCADGLLFFGPAVIALAVNLPAHRVDTASRMVGANAPSDHAGDAAAGSATGFTAGPQQREEQRHDERHNHHPRPPRAPRVERQQQAERAEARVTGRGPDG
ncbi:hypothetical protein GCM10017691_20400 [Pseudonocardia petroleophila]